MATDKKAYWKTNLRYLSLLLSIWFLVSFLCGIVFAESLNAFYIAGFPLGFWFAQQGSIYVFVIIIFIYVYLMNKLDKKFDVDEV
ncbi:DUF4212 domain-containing protein [Flavobacteriaceae bacterium]|jgi:putative solute:sodium symporter small subunit|nr:DUF4212 domain-containing protein [Flavobacteriaceae bacterium]MDA7711169.1 DUF4212 domain-containing protein [Flavobacteriaceae bacterium]